MVMKVSPISRIVLGIFVGLLVARSAFAVEVITEEDLVQTVNLEENWYGSRTTRCS
jgi:hypothetical protein